MRRMIFTLCVMALTLAVNPKAAENNPDTNRFILSYEIRTALFDHTQPRLFTLPNGPAALEVTDLESRTAKRFGFAFENRPQALALSPDAKRLCVGLDRAAGGGLVVIYDAETMTFVRQFVISRKPWDMLATDSGLIIVSGDSESERGISVFDSLTGSQVGAARAGTSVKNLALHPSQRIVYATEWQTGNNYHRFALSPAGVITSQWQVASSSPYWHTELFILPDGSRLLAGNGEFLTSTSDPATDLRPAGTSGLSPVASVAFAASRNLLIAAGRDQVRYYDYATDQLLETRSVPGVRYVGFHGERTAVLLPDPHFIPRSEIRFLSPKATSAAENIAPSVLIYRFEKDPVYPVGYGFTVRVEGRDEDGDIQSLRVFSGTNQVHFDTRDQVQVNVSIRPGTNEIYAVVQDAFGVMATSAVIRVFGNYRPQVQVEPMEPSYPSPQSVIVRATATDEDSSIVSVSLLVNDQVVAVTRQAPYEFVFNPPNPGTHYLQVRADDNMGAVGLSLVQKLFFGGAVDRFGPAILELTGTNLSITSSTIHATRQEGEPLHAGVTGGKSMWWSWRIPSQLAANGGILAIDTFGSDFDTLLAVYSGGPQGTTDITKLRLLAANDDDMTFPTASHVKFSVSGSDLLYIAVDGREGVGGTVKLRLSFAPVARPANDHFRSAAMVTASFFPATLQGGNVGATLEPAEPTHAGNPGGASVWWKLQVSNTRYPIQLSTTHSTFDTLLAVYTTNLPSHLPPVGFTNFLLIAANDDASFDTRSSSLTFLPPKPGSYWIAVDGYNGAQGRVALSISSSSAHLNVNDHFGEALLLTGTSILKTGYNHLATISPGEPLHAGKTNSGSLWYRWTAPTNGLVSISTRTSEFDTVLAVYTGTNFASLQLVAANDDDPANPPTSAVIFHATAGTVYRIAVAGYGNARGEFTLALNQTPGYTPRLLSQWAQGKLWLNATNTFGTTVLEGSTNLVNWQIVQTIGGAQSVEIPPLANRSQQFYRLRLVE